MCVYDSNTFFHMITEDSIKTGFLICHSFIDFLYIVILAPFGEIDCPSAYAKEYPLPDCLVTQKHSVFFGDTVKSEN